MKNTFASSCPRVSVLVPAFNEEKYIENALVALLKQDYENFEIIVIDNASSDRTSEIVSKFINPHENRGISIRLAYEASQGTQFARECGRRLATGSIIAQMDADCSPSPNWISKGVRLIQRGYVAASGPYRYYESPFFIRLLTLSMQLTIVKALNSISQYAKRGAVLIGGNTFARADVLDAAGGFNTQLRFYGDDVDMAARLARLGTVCFSNRLMMKTSSRRYSSMGFFQVQHKYNRMFFGILTKGFIKEEESLEAFHPR